MSLQKRAKWKSKTGFIFAAIGSAAGLGNIWRFSYLCYRNGGGAFLLPYFIALIVVGIPLMILEFGIGHREKGSAPKSFYSISSKLEWIGWWPVVFVMFGIVVYYNVIISWCVNYFYHSFNLSWGADPGAFFDSFLNVTSGPASIGSISLPILGGLILVWIISWIIVFFGVQRGIERATKILIPSLFVLTIILAVWAATLPGAGDGLIQYLRPDFSSLADAGVWIDAFSQIFFTLSLGFGIMIVYASYLPEKTNIVGDSLKIAVGDSLFAFIAGIAVWGTLGYMANAQNVEISEVVSESVGLAFVTFPQAISLLPAFSVFFGLLFFAILTFAGISSAISIIEAFSSSLMDKFGFERKNVVPVVCAIGLLGGVVFTTGAGLYWLDIVDHYLTTYGLVAVGILECIVIGWYVKAENLRKYINSVSVSKIGKWWNYSVKIFIPALLLFFLLWSLGVELTEPYGGYAVSILVFIGVNWVVMTLVAAFVFSFLKWKKEAV